MYLQVYPFTSILSSFNSIILVRSVYHREHVDLDCVVSMLGTKALMGHVGKYIMH